LRGWLLAKTDERVQVVADMVTMSLGSNARLEMNRPHSDVNEEIVMERWR
jgi:hypothetical protein